MAFSLEKAVEGELNWGRQTVPQKEVDNGRNSQVVGRKDADIFLFPPLFEGSKSTFHFDPRSIGHHQPGCVYTFTTP